MVKNDNADNGQAIVPYGQIPDIPLYMDQLTTFIDDRLIGFKRHKADKILTKTMINNYSKDDIIPPSSKKRYDRDHAALLIIVYHLKSCLTINDISALFDAVEAAALTVEQFYGIFTAIQERAAKPESPVLYDDFSAVFGAANTPNTPETQGIAAVLTAAYVAAMRKLAAERLLDKLVAENLKLVK